MPSSSGMATLDSHEDLDAWKLATELKEWVFRITARPQVKCHFRFCDDIRRSSRSAPANISEGFWRLRPRENARFVRIALGSLGETKNHLRDAFVEKYIRADEFNAINALNARALQATLGWHNYLISKADKDDSDQPAKPTQSTGGNEIPADSEAADEQRSRQRTAKPPERTAKPPERTPEPPTDGEAP